MIRQGGKKVFPETDLLQSIEMPKEARMFAYPAFYIRRWQEDPET